MTKGLFLNWTIIYIFLYHNFLVMHFIHVKNYLLPDFITYGLFASIRGDVLFCILDEVQKMKKNEEKMIYVQPKPRDQFFVSTVTQFSMLYMICCNFNFRNK